MPDNEPVTSFSDQIKLKAYELGIDQIGFARATDLAPEGARFFDWLDRGFHGEMAWLEREPAKRVDPRAIFPEAKSVLTWLRAAWFVPAAYVVGFFVLLGVMGWHPQP